jgi:DNA repair protein RecO (recombination protein O)
MAVSWEEEGIVMAVRRFGEHDAIVSLLTEYQGRHVGLVKGGLGRKLRGVLQPGNLVKARWRARLDEQLGTYAVEGVHSYSAPALANAEQLSGLSALCAMVEATLPEREPHVEVHERTLHLVSNLGENQWAAEYARWELALLAHIGYGLDLTRCAATETTDELIYVSPKSGRAVSRGAGAPYVGKLLALPAFLKQDETVPTSKEIGESLALTGHFFDKWVFGPQDLSLPASRMRFVVRFKS